MKVHVLGLKDVSGTSEKTGNDFDMGTLFAMVPIENFSNKKVTVKGYGYEPGEMPIDPKCLEQFANFKYPCTLELVLEPSLYRGKISQIVTGTTSTAPVKAVSNG